MIYRINKIKDKNQIIISIDVQSTLYKTLYPFMINTLMFMKIKRIYHNIIKAICDKHHTQWGKATSIFLPWTVWLTWLGIIPQSKCSLFNSWWGHMPCLGCRSGPRLAHIQEATNFLSHIDVSLSLFLYLKINKIFFKKCFSEDQELNKVAHFHNCFFQHSIKSPSHSNYMRNK